MPGSGTPPEPPDLPRPDEAAGRALFDGYLAAHPEVPPGTQPVPVECFGDSAALAQELLGFMLAGTKRATASLVAEYVAEGEELPRVGDHTVVCDGAGRPHLVLRTTELRLGPLSSVDERFAWDEGEYERTLESWRREHRAFFTRSCRRIGIDFHDGLELVLQRFAVVWPPEHRDA